MRFLGHLLRMDENTPARKALTEFLKQTKKRRGRPRKTWWSLIIDELKHCNIRTDMDWLERLANDREEWKKICKLVMSSLVDE